MEFRIPSTQCKGSKGLHSARGRTVKQMVATDYAGEISRRGPRIRGSHAISTDKQDPTLPCPLVNTTWWLMMLHELRGVAGSATPIEGVWCARAAGGEGRCLCLYSVLAVVVVVVVAHTQQRSLPATHQNRARVANMQRATTQRHDDVCVTMCVTMQRRDDAPVQRHNGVTAQWRNRAGAGADPNLNGITLEMEACEDAAMCQGWLV